MCGVAGIWPVHPTDSQALLERMLKSIDVDYEEVDMSQDPVALEMVKTLGYTAAPVVVSGDDHWSGFRMEKIQALSA